MSKNEVDALIVDAQERKAKAEVGSDTCAYLSGLIRGLQIASEGK